MTKSMELSQKRADYVIEGNPEEGYNTFKGDTGLLLWHRSSITWNMELLKVPLQEDDVIAVSKDDGKTYTWYVVGADGVLVEHQV